MSQSDPITFINRFTQHGSPEEFERIFADVAEFFREQPGFIEYTLLRERGSDQSFANVARWESLEALQVATRHPDFQPHVVALRQLSTSEATIYTPRFGYVSSPILVPGNG